MRKFHKPFYMFKLSQRHYMDAQREEAPNLLDEASVYTFFPEGGVVWKITYWTIPWLSHGDSAPIIPLS